MAEEKSGSSFPFQSLGVLLLLLSSTFLVSQIPYQALRPYDPQKPHGGFNGDQDVEARLWQDPFKAIEDLEKDPKPRARTESCDGKKALDTHSADYFRCRLKNRFGRRDAPLPRDVKPIVVLGVMVQGGPFTGAEEARRRTRYAVLSGLIASGLVPVDAERVGYVRPDQNIGSSTLIVPFERFVAAEESRSPNCGAVALGDGEPGVKEQPDVLVMWLDDVAFQENPISTLAALRRRLFGNEVVEFKLIGPTGSGGLREAVKETTELASTRNFQAALEQLAGTEIYSPFATAELKRILDDPLQFGNISGFRFFRVVSSDDRLAEALRNELDARGVDFSPKSGDRVVLITESDTFYARTLPDSVGLAFNSPEECNGEAGCKVFRFRYLRGLDGSLPGDPAGSPGRNTDREKDRKNPDPASIEWPEGRDQRDYLRRLTDEVRTAANRLRAACGLQQARCDSIKAIGVLGSDVHDKILVLQALRDQFPGALFFTTDLDARLLHPAVFPWTRNLIVASGFGLGLRPEVQGTVPPFRESYQTATFLAARLAMHNTRGNAIPGYNWEGQRFVDVNRVSEWLKQARVYEIGRGHPYSLGYGAGPDGATSPSGSAATPRPRPGAGPVDADEIVTGKSCPSLLQCEDVHPQYTDLEFNIEGRLVYFLVAAFALFCLLYLYSWTWRNGINGMLRRVFSRGDQERERRLAQAAGERAARWPSSRRIAIWMVLLMVTLTSLLLWELLWDGPRSGNEEPFSWVGGVSVWPSEMIRLVAIGASLYFLMRALFDIKRNASHLTATFFPDLSRRNENRGRDAAPVAGRREDVSGMTSGAPARVSGSRRRREISRAYLILLALLVPAVTYLAKRTSIYFWRGRRRLSSQRQQVIVDGEHLWEDYLKRGTGEQRTIRVAFATLLFLVFSFAIVTYFGIPSVPVRGDNSRMLMAVSVGVLITVFGILLFTVADATRLCTRLVENLMEAETEYPPSTYAVFRKRLDLNPRIENHCMDDWIDVKLIAERTEFVSKLIYYPFIVLALMILARSRLFDNWHLPPGLILVLGVSLLIAVSLALLLERSAAHARSIALTRMSDNLLRMHGLGPDWGPARAQLQDLIERVRSLRQGAFLPFSQQPLVRAALVPLTGLGGIQFLEYFLWMPR